MNDSILVRPIMLHEPKNTSNEILDTDVMPTTPQPERALSLVLNYTTAPDKQDNGNLRIVSDELLTHILNNNDHEEAKKLRADLEGMPSLIDNNPSITADLYEAFSEILDLYTEIEHKRNGLIDVNISLKEKLDALKAVNKITVNQDVFDTNEESINRYITLIGELIKEVREEVELVAMMIQCKKVYITHAPTAAYPHDPFEILKNKVKGTRRYIKNVRRDINVSYSRYSFGLNAQMKQISYFEMATNGEQKS